MGQNTKTVTDQSFQADVLGADKPVLVDFWAEWCGPCRMIAPALEEIAAELGDQVTIGKVNVDEQPALASRFAIRSIPSLLFFKDGELKDQLVGAVPKAQIVKRLDALLALV
jgi:thioredoxin 1